MKTGTKPRKTLIQLQGEFGVKDPSAHAKRQVGELDKTAARSLAKRKFVTDQMASDTKELKHIDEEIAQLRKGYDPLCEELDFKVKQRKQLLETLDNCMKEQHMIMSNVKGTVNQRKQDDMKLSKRMAKAKLEAERGYSLGPQSTFSQSGRLPLTVTKTAGGRTMKPGLAASTGKLPTIGSPSGTLKRNESSVL